jgi:hypothetical protein
MREFCWVVEMLFCAAVCIFWLVKPCSFITGYQLSESRAASVFRVDPETTLSLIRYRSCLCLSLISSFLFNLLSFFFPVSSVSSSALIFLCVLPLFLYFVSCFIRFLPSSMFRTVGISVLCSFEYITVYCGSCIECIVVILCAIVVLCVYCCFYFRCRTAG